MNTVIFFALAMYCSVDANQQPTQDCITVEAGRYSLYENCQRSLAAFDARVKEGQAGERLAQRRFRRQSACEPRVVPAVPFEEWSQQSRQGGGGGRN